MFTHTAYVIYSRVIAPRRNQIKDFACVGIAARVVAALVTVMRPQASLRSHDVR